MKSIFIPLFITITTLILPAHAKSELVTWTTLYESSTKTSTLACSDYLAQQGFNTLGDYSRYPDVGGIVAGSVECGACYQISNSINTNTFLVVDNNLGHDTGAYATISKDLASQLYNGAAPASAQANFDLMKVHPSMCTEVIN